MVCVFGWSNAFGRSSTSVLHNQPARLAASTAEVRVRIWACLSGMPQSSMNHAPSGAAHVGGPSAALSIQNLAPLIVILSEEMPSRSEGISQSKDLP